MNFKHKLKMVEEQIKSCSNDFETFKQQYILAIKKTNEFLKCCEMVGIKRVSLGVFDKKIKSCKDWPFGFGGSAFADERHGTWPAIWKACELARIGCGSGNTGQKEINSAYPVLTLTDWAEYSEAVNNVSTQI